MGLLVVSYSIPKDTSSGLWNIEKKNSIYWTTNFSHLSQNSRNFTILNQITEWLCTFLLFFWLNREVSITLNVCLIHFQWHFRLFTAKLTDTHWQFDTASPHCEQTTHHHLDFLWFTLVDNLPLPSVYSLTCIKETLFKNKHLQARPISLLAWSYSFFTLSPSSQLIHRSPRVRKQATACLARWWIQPSFLSWVMMASMKG